MDATTQATLAKLLTDNYNSMLLDSTFFYKEQANEKPHTVAYKDLLKGGLPDKTYCNEAAKTIVWSLKDSDGLWGTDRHQKITATLWTHNPISRGLGAAWQKGRYDGLWWFESKLVKRWEAVYAAEMPGKRRDKVMEALRPMLAVSRDWNDMLRLMEMNPEGAGIPVLTGQGKYKPIYSNKSPKYDEREKVVFIGGYQQVFVPFVPLELVRPYAWK